MLMHGLRLERPLHSRPCFPENSSRADGWPFILKQSMKNVGKRYVWQILLLLWATPVLSEFQQRFLYSAM
jgi:uncharacterized membrane protein